MNGIAGYRKACPGGMECSLHQALATQRCLPMPFWKTEKEGQHIFLETKMTRTTPRIVIRSCQEPIAVARRTTNCLFARWALENSGVVRSWESNESSAECRRNGQTDPESRRSNDQGRNPSGWAACRPAWAQPLFSKRRACARRYRREASWLRCAPAFSCLLTLRKHARSTAHVDSRS